MLLRRRVDILHLAVYIPILHDRLVIPIEGHIAQIRAHNLLSQNRAIVVQELVDHVAILREDAIRMRDSAVVVDGVEDVVDQFVGSLGDGAGGAGAGTGQAADCGVD